MHHQPPEISADRLRPIRFLDTTLRDGIVGTRLERNQAGRRRLVGILDGLGIDIVAVGYPALSQASFDDVRDLARQRRSARLVATIGASGSQMRRALDCLADAGNVGILVQAPGAAEGGGRIEALKRELGQISAQAGAANIDWLGLEVVDATRGDHRTLEALTRHAAQAGFKTVIMADSVGRALAGDVEDLVRKAKAWAGADVTIGADLHADLGLAAANAVAAIAAGVDMVQGALCGLGPRGGVAAIEEAVTALIYRPDHLRATTSIDLTAVTEACRRLIELAGLPVTRNKPIVGDFVFATAAGLHQHGLLNHPITYEYLDPADFGRERKILIGRHSGRAVLRARLADAGVNVDPDTLERLYQAVMRAPDLERYNETSELIRLYRAVIGQEADSAEQGAA